MRSVPDRWHLSSTTPVRVVPVNDSLIYVQLPGPVIFFIALRGEGMGCTCSFHWIGVPKSQPPTSRSLRALTLKSKPRPNIYQPLRNSLNWSPTRYEVQLRAAAILDVRARSPKIHDLSPDNPAAGFLCSLTIA